MKIHIRESDDWIALYKDGKKVWANHSCPIDMGLTALGIDFTTAWAEPDEDWDDMSWFFVEELPDSFPQVVIEDGS